MTHRISRKAERIIPTRFLNRFITIQNGQITIRTTPQRLRESTDMNPFCNVSGIIVCVFHRQLIQSIMNQSLSNNINSFFILDFGFVWGGGRMCAQKTQLLIVDLQISTVHNYHYKKVFVSKRFWSIISLSNRNVRTTDAWQQFGAVEAHMVILTVYGIYSQELFKQEQ